MKYDIIIQGGQSNAEGTGFGPVSNDLALPVNIYYLEAEKTVEVRDHVLYIDFADKPFVIKPAQERIKRGETYGDFSLTFAKAYVEAGLLEEDRQLLIVRGAIGGAGFKRGQWGLGRILYEKMIDLTDYACALEDGNRVVAFLWHQGETDAVEKNIPEVYEKELRETVQDVRARYGQEIPFIAGDFAHDWKNKNLGISSPILEKIQEVIKTEKHCAFVDTSGLKSNNQIVNNGDDIHFCRESLRELGLRYFSAFQQIEKNK